MYKTKLQELCQQRSWSLPEYGSSKEGPDHNPRFKATVIFNGQPFHSQNHCKSSKEAQNDAASLAFHHFTNPILSSFPPFPQPSFPSSSGSSTVSSDLDSVVDIRFDMKRPKIQEETNQTPPPQDNATVLDIQHLYKNQLQNYAQKRNLGLPVYSCEHEGPSHASRFKCKVTIDGQTYESSLFFPTLKDAEHAVARVALVSLSPNGVKEDDSGFYKNLLQELVQKEGFRFPVYETNRSGEVHTPHFVSTVEIEGEVFTGEGDRTKKQAELSAAKVAYMTLKER